MLFAGLTNAQDRLYPTARFNALGRTKWAFVDSLVQLGAFRLNQNPAGFIADTKTFSNTLRFVPQFYSENGDLRRRLDAEAQWTSENNVEQLIALGSDKVFFGSASFNYENRARVANAVQLFPYHAGPFYITDDTVSGARLQQPEIHAIYSLLFSEQLSFGVEGGYRLIDALRFIGSSARTIDRHLKVCAGVMYQMNTVYIGTSFEIEDGQEKIDARGVDVFNISLRKFRGERLSTVAIGSTLNSLTKRRAYRWGAEAIYKSENSTIEGGIVANLRRRSFSIGVPSSSLVDIEDTFTNQEQLSTSGIVRRQTPTNNLTAMVSFERASAWGSLSRRNLLLAEWTINEVHATLSGSQAIASTNTLAGVELMIGSISMDSSLYIDNQFAQRQALWASVSAGIEQKVFQTMLVRFGIGLSKSGIDAITGIPNSQMLEFTGGFGLLFKKTLIEVAVSNRVRRTAQLKRNGLMATLQVTFY